MHMRIVRFQVEEKVRQQLGEMYAGQVLPRLQELPSCRFASLLKNQRQAGELLSLTSWANRGAADDYASGPVFRRTVEQLMSALAGKGGAEPAAGAAAACAEPLVSTCTVVLQQELKPACSGPATAMSVRLVALQLQPGKGKEFKRIYIRKIIPALEKTRGCCRAFLLENAEKPEEMVSLTYWERPQDIHRYEDTGEFSLLLDKIEHTLTHLSHWQEEPEKGLTAKVRSSDKVEVTVYTPLCGFDRDAVETEALRRP